MNTEETIRLLKDSPDLRPPETLATEGLSPMVFLCSFANEGAGAVECEAATRSCPDELMRFWRAARSAKLFEDVTYGQWGLEILSPDRAAAETEAFRKARPADAVKGDMILGRFIGDSNLLLIRCDPKATDFGAVMVVAPIDPRPDWSAVAHSLDEFFERYVESRGEMYWEKA
jgi:hypothetical protein